MDKSCENFFNVEMNYFKANFVEICVPSINEKFQ